MSASNKFKKLSAVAVTAALAMASVNVARGVNTNYYRTGFETTPNTGTVNPLSDSNFGNPVQTYSTGNLIGTNNWQDANGGNGSAGTPQVVAGQYVSMTAQGGTGGTYADVYTSDANLTAGTLATYGNQANVSFDLNRQGVGTRAHAFGVEILSAGQDAVLASLFLGNADDGSAAALTEDVFNTPSVYAGYGRNDGNWGTYHIQLNFNDKTFTVFVDGNTVDYTFPMSAAAQAALSTEGNGIGAIAFSNTNDGTDSALYDNLQVVPEPGGIAMVGCGTLLLLSKRRRRTA
jgi:hypothetical protein